VQDIFLHALPTSITRHRTVCQLFLWLQMIRVRWRTSIFYDISIFYTFLAEKPLRKTLATPGTGRLKQPTTVYNVSAARSCFKMEPSTTGDTICLEMNMCPT
jgi:hypothetical protein